MADYLQSPPQLPLEPPSKTPPWSSLGADADKDKAHISLQEDSEKSWGKEDEIGGSEVLSWETQDGALRSSPLPEQDRLALGRAWDLPAGARQVYAAYGKVYWIDGQGRLSIHDWKQNQTWVFPYSEPVTRFAPFSMNVVYVAAGKTLQRWELDHKTARRISPGDFDASIIDRVIPNLNSDLSSADVFFLHPGGWVKSYYQNMSQHSGSFARLEEEGEPAEKLRAGGAGLFYRVRDGKTTVWKRSNPTGHAEEYGTIPFAAQSMTAVSLGFADRTKPKTKTLLVATAEGLVQWDLEDKKYRLIPISGLSEPASRGEVRVQVDDNRVMLCAGTRLFEISQEGLRREISAQETVWAWSDKNPMYVKDGALHIGDFSFPLAKAAPRPFGLRWWDALKRLLGLAKAPQEVLDLGVSEQDWQALNLPSNKRLIYDTLSGFSVGLHALYVGETGGGKTWIAERVAKLTANKLWLVSFKEHTRAKDFIYRETFGEEGKGRTGLTYGPVLRWMIEGGVLVLDEIHKPLEGVADLNNILANGEFQMPDGTIIKLDPKKSFVIATMNPVKPPYRGEPPSGELASRFGMTKEVNYLPEEEEYGLLRIFFKEAPQALLRKLVGIANELRPLYPDPLGLPIASRTLVNFMKYMQAYPDTDAVNQFMIAYNPVAITQDLSARDAIVDIIKKHDLAGEGPEAVVSAPARRNIKELFPEKSGPAAAPAQADDGDADPDRDGYSDGGYYNGGADSAMMDMMDADRLMSSMPFTSPKTPGAWDKVTPEMEAWAKVLEDMARMLARFPLLRLVPFYYVEKRGESIEETSRRWRTLIDLFEIHYLPNDMGELDREVAQGRTAHEVWHLLFSRPDLILDEPELIDNMSFQALWWAVEDPRVNNLGLARHPGAKPWINAAYAKDYAIHNLDEERRFWDERIPMHMQFLYALVYQWWAGRPDPRVTDPRVAEALKRAGPAIRRAIKTQDAARAFAVIRDQIWPIYKELIEEQVQDKSRQNQRQNQKQDGRPNDQKQDGQSQGGESPDSDGEPSEEDERHQRAQEQEARDQAERESKDYREKHAPSMSQDPEKMSKEQQEKAKKEMEEARDKMEQSQRESQGGSQKEKQQGRQGGKKADQSQGQQSSPDKNSGGTQGRADQPDKADDPKQAAKQKERLGKADEEHRATPADRVLYQDYLRRVQKFIPFMRQQFQHALRQQLRQRVIHNRDDGDLDPDSFPRIPMGARDVFSEEMSPNKVLYRVSLLIDFSGSMKGEKKERSIEGAVMMMEALEKVPGVAFEIVIYDSVPLVLKPYNKKLTPDLKASIVGIINGNGGSTDTFTALKEAIGRVRMGRGDKMIIVVNDGDPDKSFDREAFRQMVIAARDVEIHGIGLGSEAQMVLDLFPPGRGWWLKDVADFVKNLRRILTSKLMSVRR